MKSPSRGFNEYVRLLGLPGTRCLIHPYTLYLFLTPPFLLLCKKALVRGLGWQINFCWIPREQNEECDALSKKTADKPDSTHSLQVPA
jgi:hypothetical protein